MGPLASMRALVGLLLALAASAHVFPAGDFEDRVGDLGVLGQQGETEPPRDVASYTATQFAQLMNQIITRASQMRVVMNKLGISDTDSVAALEQHFVRLGQEHADLGEGMTSQEELRAHGLKARACVKYATSCSREAAGCQGAPKDCFSDSKVVDGCTRAAATCGVGDLRESAESDPKDDPALIEEHKNEKKTETAPAKTAPPASTPKKKEEAPAAPQKKEPAPAAPQKKEEAAKSPPASYEELELLQLDLEKELPGLIESGVKAAF